MVINTNLSAINAWRALEANNTNTQKALQKLSSGYRINSAADDAAGLAISEKMKAQIAGLNMAQRNAQDGISLIQTAEGALNETTSILQRMRELAVQAANDTNTDQDRGAIQSEINQLKDEITRIANTTQFNQKTLLNGNLARAVTITGTNGVLSSATITVNPGSLDVGSYTLTVSQYASRASIGDATEFSSPTTAGTININGTNISIASGDDINTVIAKINAFTNETGVQASAGSKGIKLTSVNKGSDQTIQVSGVKDVLKSLGLTTDTGADVGVYSDAGTDAVATLTPQSGGSAINLKAVGNNLSDDITGLNISLGNVSVEGTPTDSNPDTATIIVTSGGELKFQIGANKDQSVSLSIDKMDANSLGVANIDLTTQAGANSALTAIDNAIDRVSSVRGNLGALQNRLEHTVNNLGTASENLTAANSRIRDVDMAQEMMEFTKDNILNQAATAMLEEMAA
ncbi:MAG: flagellin [Thermoanaerobacterium thermosaccharolyticum]|jgi:flagellin